MHIVYGDITYISNYTEGFFHLETLCGEKWICYPINKEERWDDIYELAHNNEHISCYIESKIYGTKEKAYIAKVIL